jgi:Derlin-2/3
LAHVVRWAATHWAGARAGLQVYVWGRRNEHVRLTFLNLFPFTAPYLPWVLLTFSVVLGNPATIDVIGIVVGHTYYFLEFVFPVVAEARGWGLTKLLHTPGLLKYICGEYQHDEHVNFVPEPEPEPPTGQEEHPHED